MQATIRIYASSGAYYVADDILDGVGFDGPFIDPSDAAQAALNLEEQLARWTPAHRAKLSAKIGADSQRDPQEVGN